jgi:hypothetical protein
MMFACSIMAVVFLLSETRLRAGESGINQPSIKIIVVLVTFVLLAALQITGIIDPSNLDLSSDPVVTNVTDYSKSLPGVCDIQARGFYGFLLYVSLTTVCLGIVIFGTSIQTWEGLFGSNQKKRTNTQVKICLFIGGILSVLLYLAFFAFVPLWWTSRERENSGCS